MAKPSDFTRSERRRQQRLSQMSERERRANTVADAIAAIEIHPEDEDIREEIARLSDWIRKRGKVTHEDDQQLILKVIKNNYCHYIEDMVHETGLTELVVRRTVQNLLLAGVLAIQRIGSRKMIVINDLSVLKVA